MAADLPSRLLAAAGIVACGVLGVWGTLVAGAQDGLFEALTLGPRDAAGTRYVPGGLAPLRTAYTGVTALDHQLNNLVVFFAAFMDGAKPPGATAVWWYFFVQFGLGWVVFVLEGLRGANRGRAVSWTGTMGLIVQNFSYALNAPLYVLLHLFNSPTARLTPTLAPAAILPPSDLDVVLIAPAFLAAFAVPFVLMSLPSPALLSSHAHYGWIAFWQLFPLWQSILHSAAHALFSGAGVAIASARTDAPALRNRLRLTRTLYSGIIAASAAAHISLLLVALMPASAIPPTWPAEIHELAASLDFRAAFLPALPWTHPPAMDAAAAAIPADAMPPLVLFFLQWDIYGGTAAMLVWAVFLRCVAGPGSSWAGAAVRAVVWSVLCGPVAGVVSVLRERDEAVFAGWEEQKKA